MHDASANGLFLSRMARCAALLVSAEGRSPAKKNAGSAGVFINE